MRVAVITWRNKPQKDATRFNSVSEVGFVDDFVKVVLEDGSTWYGRKEKVDNIVEADVQPMPEGEEGLIVPEKGLVDANGLPVKSEEE